MISCLIFYLVTGTSYTNSRHEGTKQNLKGQVPATSPFNSNQFEFVGRVAGTNVWSLRLEFIGIHDIPKGLQCLPGNIHTSSWKVFVVTSLLVN